jgi:apolipoprotein N-acyltransferase
MRSAVLNFGLALASAALLILSVPRFNISVLAAIALAPLLVALYREPRNKYRFLLGWVCGFTYWFGVCYWIQFVMAFHGGMGDPAGWGVFLLFCLAKGLHFAVFALLAGMVLGRPWAVLVVAALWTGIERTNGPLGFAWFTLGNAGIDMGVPLRLAPIVGVYGISFLFALLSAALAGAAVQRPRRELAWALLPLSVLFLPDLPPYKRGAEAAAVVQPNISETEQWTTDSYNQLIHRMTIDSLQAALNPNQNPVVFLAWPEAPAPFYYEQNAQFRQQINQLAQTIKAPVVVGNVTRGQNNAPLNSATIVSPDGKVIDRYDKMFLVPFGEFVPPFFSWVNKVSPEVGDFMPGNRVVVAPVDGHKLGVFICYESVFPHLVRRFVNAGADVLLNISNDGYFGRLSGREQHLKIARMRAVENNRWIIRATNDGISAVVDPAGRITQTLPDHMEAFGRMRFNYRQETTFYTRHGDWFAWGCLALGLVAVLETQIPRYQRI